MFKKWLDTQPKANWGQLIEALREVELTDAAELLQRRLSGKLCQIMFADVAVQLFQPYPSSTSECVTI